MDIAISEIKPSDLAQINNIINNPEVSYFFNFTPPLSLDGTLRWYQEVVYKRSSNNGECLVARNGDRVLGWSYFHELTDIKKDLKVILDRYLHQFSKLRMAYIAATVVDPQYKGQGIGKKLIQEDESCLVNYDYRSVWFGTNSDNNALKHMHEVLGYLHIGTIQNFKTRKNGSVVDQHIYCKILQ